MTCGAGGGGTGLWCLEAPPALSVVSVPSGMSHDASSRVATSKALRGWPEVAARRIGCWSCRLFIRNSSAIHPQFIRNSSLAATLHATLHGGRGGGLKKTQGET
jgi:hypothetical protein